MNQVVMGSLSMVYYAMARKKKKKITSNIFVLFDAIGYIFKSPVVISWILAICGLITLTAMSVPSLRATQISAANLNVTISTPPIWLDDSLLLELQDVARIHLAKTTVSRQGLIETANALSATGWFREINQVQWVNDTKVIVKASFLIPFAQVQDKKGKVYIDDQGRRLPTRVGAIVKPNYHFITLIEPKSERPQRSGLQWNGTDILSAISLLKLIYDKPWATQIKAINLSRFASSGSMILETDTPSLLKWGSAPGEERGLEALADQKIDRLNHLYKKHGLIDEGSTADFDLTNTTNVIQH